MTPRTPAGGPGRIDASPLAQPAFAPLTGPETPPVPEADARLVERGIAARA